jgi:hypothetical protein
MEKNISTAMMQMFFFQLITLLGQIFFTVALPSPTMGVLVFLALVFLKVPRWE